MAVLLAGLFLSACERVTAPKALEIADDLEHQVWHGKLPSFHGSELSNAWLNFKGRSTILVSTDESTQPIEAVVIERVFVPPAGQGMPFSRRSLVAIPRTLDFGILAVTSTNADERNLAEFNADDLNPRPSLVVARERNEDWWIPGSGRVEIAPVSAGSACPFENSGVDVAADSSGRVTCNVSTYLVHAEGELVRRRDAENALLPEAMKQRHRIFLAPQQVNGIRFTIRCPEKDPVSALGKTWYGIDCAGNPVQFWRSNTLFARSLGVDVTKMERASVRYVTSTYVRTLREGSEKQPPGSRVIRWTLSYPDGTVMERDSTIDYSPDLVRPDRGLLMDCARGLLYGGRRQCILPQAGLPKWQSPYGVYVLDMEDAARR
jgi:hypothetical protein